MRIPMTAFFNTSWSLSGLSLSLAGLLGSLGIGMSISLHICAPMQPVCIMQFARALRPSIPSSWSNATCATVNPDFPGAECFFFSLQYLLHSFLLMRSITPMNFPSSAKSPSLVGFLPRHFITGSSLIGIPHCSKVSSLISFPGSCWSATLFLSSLPSSVSEYRGHPLATYHLSLFFPIHSEKKYTASLLSSPGSVIRCSLPSASFTSIFSMIALQGFSSMALKYLLSFPTSLLVSLSRTLADIFFLSAVLAAPCSFPLSSFCSSHVCETNFFHSSGSLLSGHLTHPLHLPIFSTSSLTITGDLVPFHTVRSLRISLIAFTNMAISGLHPS
mmetsp:Transcript_26059/g.31627  ORF Transcript_26059/g.31627 Transcript_26059/m.31627 type:complete len:331 (-) Transcript_26059:1476-2468(-)